VDVGSAGYRAKLAGGEAECKSGSGVLEEGVGRVAGGRVIYPWVGGLPSLQF
jgi:hypothetical protein